MFVPYSVFNIHSHMPEEKIPDSYDRCELGLNAPVMLNIISHPGH